MPTGHSAFQIIVYIVISALCAYSVGRIHEWYKRSMDRDRSFREGYNHGYHALFPLAAQGTSPASDLTGPVGRDEPDEQASEPLWD
jgi:hypothetical protein